MNKKLLKKLNISKDNMGVVAVFVSFGLFVGSILFASIAGNKQIEKDKKLNDPRLNTAIDTMYARKYRMGAGQDYLIAKDEYEAVRKRVLAEQKSKTK